MWVLGPKMRSKAQNIDPKYAMHFLKKKNVHMHNKKKKRTTERFCRRYTGFRTKKLTAKIRHTKKKSDH
jgi:hypothetical protein